MLPLQVCSATDETDHSPFMSQLTIQLSDKADALIAQLQKEIFNRRRKKVSAEGVIETLLESGAKSQSDKRFATSWRNLVADIEKAAKIAETHGAKPANLTDEEWALVLSHRTRASGGAGSGARRKPATRKRSATAKAPAPAVGNVEGEARAAGTTSRKPRATATPTVTAKKATATAGTKGSTRKPSGKATAPSRPAGSRTRSSVARRMAKAVSRLGNGADAGTAVGSGVSAGNGAMAPEAPAS
jgi:hypothetical protein